jgi:DNA-binding CsgD family transcriptional regulator
MLYGREEQLAVVDQILAGMRSGRAGALILRGEVGIGKTALLDAVAEQANDARVLRVTGVEAEAELPFAGLHALMRPALDEIGALPERQAEALRGAFGMAEAAVADRFLVGLGVLSLIAELAEDRPVICLVDDAQWLDQASADALVFAARRLHAERAAVILAARDEPVSGSLPGLPELRVSGLGRPAAEQLLAGSGLVQAVRDELIAEAGGNPLALIELSRGLSEGQRAGSVTPLTVPAVSPVGRVQQAFGGRVAVLTQPCRRAMLVAALAGLAELPEVSRAIEVAGGSLTDLAPAERAGLLRVTPASVVFSHPLVRSAVLADSDVAGRVAAHQALADVNDGDRRAWHLAALAIGPDEEVAAALDAAAQRAALRGSSAAVSAAYERAAGLSADAAPRGLRLALAAEAAAYAGQMPRAAGLAEQARRQVTDPGQAAALAGLRAFLEAEAGRIADAAGFLLEEAALLGQADSGGAQVMVLEGFQMLWVNAGPAPPRELEYRAAAILPPAAASLVAFLQAVRQLQDSGPDGPISLPAQSDLDSLPVTRFSRFSRLFFDLIQGDVQSARRRAADMTAEFRDTGSVGLLAYALTYLADVQGLCGEFLDATASAEEGLRIAVDTGQIALISELTSAAAMLAAIAGDEQACQARVDQARDLSAGLRALPLAAADHALAVLDLGSARYQSALDRMEAISAGPGRQAPHLLYAYPDHVEAAVRAGQPALAARPLAIFTAWSDAIGQPWASAVAARCAALTAPDAAAETLYQRAIAGHQGDGRPFEQARTLLLFGEWLRRNQRRADARGHLLEAAGAFARMGARPWQDRAESELRAAGAAALPVRADDPLARLTPQELQVVRLAAAGASNKQIGAQLFLSPRTVGYHLYKVFPKLGISTRDELARYAP